MTSTRRRFLKTVAGAPVIAAVVLHGETQQTEAAPTVNPSFLIQRDQLNLNYSLGNGAQRLSFKKYRGTPTRWRNACRRKLAELCRIALPPPAPVRELRSASFGGVTYRALILDVNDSLSIPAYLLEPGGGPTRGAVMAIHGHGDVEALIGVHDDYHHRFGLELAKAGHAVLCPALRGFGVLRDLAWSSGGARCLNYWDWERGPQFTLVTDGFLHGRTLIGQTVEDLLRWEDWFCRTWRLTSISVAGISYGGDLAILYPVFSKRVRKIFASGTLGSFVPVFSRCYNAPAHCIPGVLEWMDRSDIAGLNAPRPIALHYGELDKPGPDNNSASYNETVEPSVRDLRAIYKAFGAETAIELFVTPGRGHEMDIDLLRRFLANE